MFDLLGVRPIVGRGFAAGEDAESAPRVALLGEALWRRRFSADPAVVGRVVTLDGNPWEIIGVLPDEGGYPAEAELWLPTRFSKSDLAESNRGARWLRVVARLTSAATLEKASTELSTIASRLALKDPKHNTGYGAHIVPMQEAMVGDLRRPLFVLFGAVGFVLLIACANVASLLLGRTAARETEMALRSALGAARGRIVRQVMTESLVLAVFGGIGGVLLGLAGMRFLVAMAPSGIPRLGELQLNGTMFAFTALATLMTGALFGVVPAMQASAAICTPGSRTALAARGERPRDAGHAARL